MSPDTTIPTYSDVRAYKQDEVDGSGQWVVSAGDYADDPDLLIYIDHAVDEDGYDRRAAVAAQIVRVIGGRADYDGLAAAFEQWKADYDAAPESFLSHPDFIATPPKSYGEAAARTLLRYLGGAA